MSSNIEGKRLAGAHLIFNLVTGLIAIIFIHQIMYSVDFISNFVGISNDDYTLKLAVFHTIFNTIGVVVMIPFIDKLVIFLESTLKSPERSSDKSIDNAKYLNDSVLELPSTAMAAIRRETYHLYENAFEIISHGINIKRSNILSTIPLDQVVQEKYSNKKVNIDDFYNRKIKGIYGEIIDFSTKAQANMTPNDIDQLYKLKLANKDIVEAVKDTKHLQKNLVLYSNNKNLHIQEQYTNMKKDLVKLLRSINTISTSKKEEEILVLLSKAKLHAQKYDFIANGTLDNLIRNSLITNEMATSLMNDSSYAFDISKKLVSMAEILYNKENNALLIDDEDVQTILNEKGN
jgi:phosphate:Na+ symporter